MSAIASADGMRRDRRTISLVGSAHFSSHMLQLALPPLFPILHGVFGVSFTELGAIMTLFYAASGLGQAAAGVLVDRFGAYRLLLAGLTASSAGIALTGLATAYWMLLPLAGLAGLGNSVFHPADLSILSHRVGEGRLGRAFAVHALLGQVGFAAAPLVITAIAAAASWRAAVIVFGLGGLAIAAFLYVNRATLTYDHKAEAQRHAHAGQGRASYLAVIGSPVIMMAFAYFVLTAFAGTGNQTFAVTALSTGYGLALEVATLALTGYLVGGAVGTLMGGFLADRTHHHHRVAMTGMLIAAVLMLAMTSVPDLPFIVVPVMAVAGIANGLTSPSRDVLIRRAAVGSGMGKVFGFVYSGFDLGSSAAPLLFGALLDHHAPHAVFLAVAVGFALAAPTVMQVRRRRAAPAASAAE
jgi:FSR family fosmidomycin resistance protein-like MFS transporter